MKIYVGNIIIQVSKMEDDTKKNNTFKIIILIPINQQKAYRNHKLFNRRKSTVRKRIVSLPVFPEMTKKEINKVIDVVNKASKK